MALLAKQAREVIGADIEACGNAISTDCPVKVFLDVNTDPLIEIFAAFFLAELAGTDSMLWQ